MLEDTHIGFGKNVFKHNQSDCMEVTHILAGWNRGCTLHKHAIADLVYRHGNDNDGGEGNSMKGMVIDFGVNQSESFSVVGLHCKLHDRHSQHRGALWWTSLCSEIHQSKVRPFHVKYESYFI